MITLQKENQNLRLEFVNGLALMLSNLNMILNFLFFIFEFSIYDAGI